VESRYELAISHFQIPRQQAEAWAYSVPPPSSSVTAIRPAYTDDGYLIGPLNESSLYPQSSSRTGLGSSDMWAESFQYSLPSPDLGAEPSNYSTASGPSATSSAVESALSIHGHVVPVPEWAPQELGFEPSIVQYDNICSNGSNDYGSQQPTGMDDYVFDLIVSSMPSPIGRYKNGPWSKTSDDHGSKTTGDSEANTSAMSSSIASPGRPLSKMGSQIPYSYPSRGRGLPYATHGIGIGRSGLTPGAGLHITSLSHGNDLDLFQHMPSEFSTLRKLKQSPIRSRSVHHVGTQSHNDELREVPSYSIPPPNQTTYLWWRAFLQLREHRSHATSIIARVWFYFENDVLNAQAGWSAAKVAERAVADLLIHLQNLPKQSFPDTSNIEHLLKAMSRIREISQVIKETLTYKFGASAWLCLSGAIQVFLTFDI